jgi:hypothetical protein
VIALTAAQLEAITAVRERVDADLADGRLLYLAGGALKSTGTISVSLVPPDPAAGRAEFLCYVDRDGREYLPPRP